MPRFLVFSVVLLGSCLAAFAQSPTRRMLLDERRHLGVAGTPEWAEFETSTPHGAQLEVTFSSEANTTEATLFIRQHNVKVGWNVQLNGKKIGALETLTQPLLLALRVPAGALKDGENRLNIVRGAQRGLDDIVIESIALDLRPRAEAVGEATVEVTVTDADTGGPVPCRITLANVGHELVPLHAAGAQRLAVRTGVVYTGDGKARVSLPAGAVVVYAGRGFEYSVASERLTLNVGETKAVALKIRREVPTPGLVAADSHIHTLTHSKHGDATIDERMLTIAGEGIEVAVATDHNHHADYTEASAKMGTSAHFRGVVGNEVSSKVGHFNSFPIGPGSAVPDHTLTDWPALWHNIRAVTGAKVITLNHPRDVHHGFTPLGPENFDEKTGRFKKSPSFGCDAIEVVTSAAMQSDVMRLHQDWFALLNHGFRVAGVGASDTHHVSEFILGQSRTYVVAADNDPAAINLEDVWASYRAGRLLISFGLLTTMKVEGRFNVGDLATNLGAQINVDVEVVGPSWITADRVELFANGIKVQEAAITPGAKVQKAKLNWKIPRPKHDVHLVAIATGPGVTAPYWDTPRPYQPTSKIFIPRMVGTTNPIWIDGDGDGKFTSAREYAAQVVTRAGGDLNRLKAALAGYDGAVETQAMDLAAK